MKKKIFSLVLCLVMCTAVLTGCNLFGRDLETYYNAVVARINYSYELNGQTITESEAITKRELINAYNSYGYNYVNNYGYSQHEAVEETLDTIINRKLMIKDVESTYKRENKELFNDSETTYLWESTYDAFYSNLRQYYNEILGIEDEEDDSQEETSGVYERYEPNATYYTYIDDNGVLRYGVKRINEVSTISGSGKVLYLDSVPYNYEYQDAEGKYVFKELIYETINSYTSNTQWRSALNRYIGVVRDNYSYVDFANDEEVFYFELDRIYDIVRDNYVVDKYEELYNRRAEHGSTLTGVRVQNMIDYYEGEVLSDYYTYRNNPSTFETDVLSTSTNVNYVYTGENASNYFYVGVIKLGFKEGQRTPTDLETDINNGKIDESEKPSQLNAIYNAVYADIKSDTTGQSTGNRIYAQDLLDEINDLMDNDEYKYLDYNVVINDSGRVDEILADEGYAREELDENQINQIVKDYVDARNQLVEYARADAFIKYYYYYNDDTTYQNSDKTSVFGISSTGDVVYNDTFSSAQNDDFDTALKALYNNGEGQVGDTSGLIRANDGIYILFYAGEVESLFPNVTSNFSLTFSDIEKFASTRVNIFNNKTYFDLVYDAIYEDNNYSNFEEENLNYLKQTLTTGDDNGIVKYPDSYSDLF